METLNLPSFQPKLQEKDHKPFIFDVIRKKFILLTPEEWVRQHFLNYLINSLDYPRSLIRVEGGLKYNQLMKRSDILVYNRNGNPAMLIECKASHVDIDRQVLDQAAMYNRSIGAIYLGLTNGLEHWCCKMEGNNIRFLERIPSFTEL